MLLGRPLMMFMWMILNMQKLGILQQKRRGWGDSAKRRILASLISSSTFKFVCIQETKREFIEYYDISNLWGKSKG